ncbi:MAG: hypothetical protein JNJ69_05860 [Leptospiraceae bacterium]|nr:hypothetical protein [Leptospiraceae bacterium]
MRLPVVTAIALFCCGICSAQESAEIATEHAEQESVDLQPVVSGSEIFIEGRNRSNTAVFVRGKLWTTSGANGEILSECSYEMQIPLRTFVSKKTRCKSKAAGQIRLTIDQLSPLGDASR